jgi:hypothetical protein
VKPDRIYVEGIITAAGMALIATVGDLVNEHRFASLWLTVFACAIVILYASMGLPYPFRNDSTSDE